MQKEWSEFVTFSNNQFDIKDVDSDLAEKVIKVFTDDLSVPSPAKASGLTKKLLLNQRARI